MSIAARRLVVIALAAAFLLGACESTGPTASPAGPASAPASGPATDAPPTPTPRPAAEVYAEIRAAVEEIRGLRPTEEVEPVTLDEAQLIENLQAEFDKENTPEEIRLSEDSLITFGLLPEGSDLRQIMLDFQSGQVAGYYSPDQDRLFVVSRSGAIGSIERVTYAHEFTHQLQDQNMDLGSLGLDADDNSDGVLAALALVEGDAVSVQVSWMLANLGPAELGELLESALDPKAMEALERAPVYVRETTIFQYQQGPAFVSSLMTGGGYDPVNEAYLDPPKSTEQVLHPEKYAEREAPSIPSLPDGVAASLGEGWSEATRDTLGELVLGLWLRINGVPRAEADAAAAGWGGDRMLMVRGPDGAIGIGLVTTWDSTTDAQEFLQAAGTAAKAVDPNAIVASDGLLRVIVALGDGAPDIFAALAG
ncbi:MAG TPA: hypothetical protein VNL94_03505 [Candidatus Binatia bacterium]|nr:hypothetical protein [Candidatus Binatia bacterium]